MVKEIINIKNIAHKNHVHLAISNGATDVLEYLIDTLNLELENPIDVCPQNREVLDFLHDKGYQISNSVIITAIKDHKLDICKKFIQTIVDNKYYLFAIDNDNIDVLHLCLEHVDPKSNNNEMLKRAINGYKIHIARYLVGLGVADIE
jgi:hypothetical protein